ncbi:La-related protein 7 [Smittium mucronatum]|uniref:La-related protein 7 n=1 Tax=Smittium mucronatum TaxID=133383 RepID=A0A1R0GNQ6_9FUNG|nr:La-related protein 7 [Smittium mucronatum]
MKGNEQKDENSEFITSQLEYYLSDWNLRKDEDLKLKISESLGGWIEIDYFYRFPRLLGVLNDETCTKTLKNIAKYSKYIEEGFIKPYTTTEAIRSLLEENVGKVAFVNPYVELSTNYFYGFAFIEFFTEENAAKCLELVKAKKICVKNATGAAKKLPTPLDDEISKATFLPNLRAWSKTEWSELKSEYLLLHERMNRDTLRPSGIEPNSILRVHGISPDSTPSTICDIFSQGEKINFIGYNNGDISAHLIYDSVAAIQRIVDYFSSKRLYHLDGASSGLYEPDNSDHYSNNNNNNTNENLSEKYFIRCRVLKGNF